MHVHERINGRDRAPAQRVKRRNKENPCVSKYLRGTLWHGSVRMEIAVTHPGWSEGCDDRSSGAAPRQAEAAISNTIALYLLFLLAFMSNAT
jgi:RNA:NAD 2'-phosphotransferase (TPT1/KptA family)